MTDIPQIKTLKEFLASENGIKQSGVHLSCDEELRYYLYQCRILTQYPLEYIVKIGAQCVIDMKTKGLIKGTFDELQSDQEQCSEGVCEDRDAQRNVVSIIDGQPIDDRS